MYTFTTYSPDVKPNTGEKEAIVSFLFKNLGIYGDPEKHIMRCLNYAVNDLESSSAGFAIVAKEGDIIMGATIINETGMAGYIPENILVYIAVHESTRGKGIGKALMKKAIEKAKGSIALHVEPDNPAKFLYEKLGFENKYLEMRLTR